MFGVLLAASALACHAPLPHGPAVPAPIVLSTSCGRFVLARSGGLTRLQARPHPGRRTISWRMWGHPLTVRRNRVGRFFVLDHGRLVWRSHGLYRNDGGQIAFGQHAFAFASYRRGVFLTDLEHPERLVVRGRGLYPTDFDNGGRLIVANRNAINLISRSGATLRRYRYRLRNGFVYDERSDTLFFVSAGGRLARARGTSVRLARPVRDVDAMISVDYSSGLLVFYGAHSVAIARRDGTLVARATWARSPRVTLDSGISVSPNRRAFAFRLSDAHPGSRSSRATVYVLRADASRAQAIYHSRDGQSGCGNGVSLSWHGRFLLYNSTAGRQAVLDTADHRAVDLTRLARLLPHRNPGETASVSWLANFMAEF